jgi:capsular polysaccharide biosynthesis protein
MSAPQETHLRVDRLRCHSVIDEALHAGSETCQVSDLATSESPVHVLPLDEVLYVPELELQIVNGGIVPREAIRDCWNLYFLQGLREDRGDARQLSFIPDRRDDEVCVLSNLFAPAFGEWVQELFHVLLLERAGFTGAYIVSNLPAFAVASLELIGVGAERIDTTVVRPTVFRRAWFTTAVSHQNVHEYPRVFAAFRDLFFSLDVSGEPGLGERLWLDRGAHVFNPGRDLVNQDEIHHLVSRYGFTIVDMGAFTLRKQVAIARRMTVLAGPHGSQFVHAMFMAERSTVVECFSPMFINPSILEICYALRHRYFQVVPVNTPYSPYEWEKSLKLLPLHLELVLRSLD